MVAKIANEPDFQFTSHPPERYQIENIDPSCAGNCCCCCCCCLHTLGGLVGALVYSMSETASRKKLSQVELDFQENITRGEGSSRNATNAATSEELSASAVYWRSILGVAGFALIVCALIMMGNNGASSILGSACIVVMVFPAVQVVAGIVSFFVVGFSNKHERSTDRYRQLMRINLGMFVGVTFGSFIMLLLYLVLKK